MFNQLFHRIEQRDIPDTLTVLVEISQGDSNKYEYDHQLDALRLDRVLSSGITYPFNYCDVPGTWNNGDQDPLDAILLSSRPINPGVVVTARIVAGLEMIDNGEIDHKIICVNHSDVRYANVHCLADLTASERNDISSFFRLYKIPENGLSTVQLGAFWDKPRAADFVIECIAAYHQKFPK